MQMPGNARRGVEGPAGTHRSGPPGRATKRFRLVVFAALVALASVGFAVVERPSGTQALFTSRATAQTNVIEGGTWAPPPPAACWPEWHKKHGWHWFMDWDETAPDHHKDWDDKDWDKPHRPKNAVFAGSGFAGPKAEGLAPFHGKSWPKMKTIYGTMGDDVLDGGNWPQIIMGLDGDDILNGGNSLDCLVGGLGDDVLNGGNSTDILIGGPGLDQLNGGNGIDILIGDAGPDQLNGGNGPDIILAGRNDVLVGREWWDIVIKINELDDCDGSGGLGGILDCLLPDGLSVTETGSLTVLEETADEQTGPTERALLAPEELSEDVISDDPASTEGEAPAQLEDAESVPAGEGSETSEPDVSTTSDSTPAVGSKDQATEPNPSDVSASNVDPTQSGSASTCDGPQPIDQNCEEKP